MTDANSRRDIANHTGCSFDEACRSRNRPIELIVNMKTAKALKTEIPATIAVRADEVIE